MKVSKLKPDPHNANQGTEEGARLLELSLRDCGFGRPVLVDRDGVLIAGNKTAATVQKLGDSDAEVIETDGRELVVVQRTDIEAGDPKARKLALLDNRTAQIGLRWDPGRVQEAAQQHGEQRIGFTAEEVLSLGQTDGSKLTLQPMQAPTNRIRVGLYRFDVDQETADNLERRILDEAKQKGLTWEEVVRAKLRI